MTHTTQYLDSFFLRNTQITAGAKNWKKTSSFITKGEVVPTVLLPKVQVKLKAANGEMIF